MKPNINDYIVYIFSSNITSRGKFADMSFYLITEISHNVIKAKHIKRKDIPQGAKLHYYSDLRPNHCIELID